MLTFQTLALMLLTFCSPQRPDDSSILILKGKLSKEKRPLANETGKLENQVMTSKTHKTECA